MSMAATAWAFETPAAESPLERLLLILMADDTDSAGVCCTDMPVIADRACISLDVAAGVVVGLCRRRVLQTLTPPEGIDPDLRRFQFFLFAGWSDRDPIESSSYPFSAGDVQQ